MTYIDQIKTDWLYTLKRRILLVVALAMVTATTLVCALLYRFLIRESVQMAAEQSALVESALENDMIQRNPKLIQGSLDAILKSDSSLRRLLILTRDGDVRFSTDPSTLGAKFERLTDPTCTSCHQSESKTLDLKSSIVHPDGSWEQREAMVLYNQPACYGCHDSSQRKLGMLLVDYSLENAHRSIVQIVGILVCLSLAFLVFLAVFLSGAEDRYIRRIVSQGEELTSLYIMVERLSQTIDRKELNAIVVGIITETLKAGEVDMVIPRDGGGHRRLTWSTYSTDPVRRKLDSHPTLAPLVERWIVNPRFDPEVTGEGLEIVMPVSKSEVRLALLVVRGLSTPFDPQRLWLIRVMADHIAAAYDNARLYTIAITDKLTGLYTRRHFEYSLDRIFGESERNNDHVALLMVDVDDFKLVNDTYGHVAGDSLLEALGAGILEVVRDTDLAFRYGGEEFAVVLPRTDATGALDVAARILEVTRAIRLEEYPHGVTVSIGAAAYPDSATSIHALIQAADRALYAAKRAGKDQFKAHGPGMEG